MVREKKAELIQQNKILTHEEIREIKINEIFLENVNETQATLTCFFAEFGLWPNVAYCPQCEVFLSVKKRKEFIDKICWFCGICKKSFSVRNNSFFENMRLNSKIVLKILYKYISKIEFVQIAFDLDISRVTVSEYCDLFREAICFFVETHSTRIGGLDDFGNQKIVEIDESLFFRRKYNRGRIRHEQWYIGGIERGSRRCFIVPVSNRNAITIAQVITENVFPGSKVITDKWRAYNTALTAMPEYQHDSINHSLHFVDPLDSTIHTQNIEGLWSRSKYFLRKKAGIGLEDQSRYLIQFLWEYSTERFNRINELLILLQHSNH